MDIKDLVVGIHGNCELESGGRYNVLSSFSVGLLKAFRKMGLQAFSTRECFEKGLIPNFTIGFNVNGYETWPEYLKICPNIMWSVDSIFYQNIEAIKLFSSNPNFILFNVSSSDEKAIGEFFPNQRHAFMPHAVDMELWNKQKCEKDLDIVFLGSVEDCDLKIAELKATMAPQTFELFSLIHEIWLNEPNLTFWQIYQILKSEGGFDLNVDDYNFLFKNLTYLITYRKRIQLIQNLSDFNVKVFGNSAWKKYVSGKAEYMGECDFKDTIDIINRAKIVLHSQPTQINQGTHERVLNAISAGSFVLSSDNPFLINTFGGSLEYYSNKDLNNVAEKAEYMLKNNSERNMRAQNARSVIEVGYTWENRAKQILEIFSIK